MNGETHVLRSPDDPSAAWELVRVKTEVVIHLRDHRFSDGYDAAEALDAALDALGSLFDDDAIATAMEHRLYAYNKDRRAAEQAAAEHRRHADLASGRLIRCPDCGKAFDARRGIQTHRRQKHGVVS